MKSRWESPKLVVLYRTTPEENVLILCKFNSAPLGTGAQQNETLGHGCQATKEQSCQACQSLGGGGKS
ncbi:hypothetical protein JW906_00970 [bacterium]|nr:hypothetical protein [bacterium]